ncbi:MAG: ribosome small subunit-dependent GTPase A [Clostridiales bacterium]|nr:ribosome small subunit-dependent GTPase A [Clostridiales bacterium]
MAEENAFNGVITKGVGGVYTVRFMKEDNLCTALCAARGIFRLRGIKPAIGDRVTIMPSEDPDVEYIITDIAERTSLIARPPVANLETMLLTFSVTNPAPDLTLLDKMLLLCTINNIRPVIIFTKSDLNEDDSEKLCSVYTKAGYEVLVSSPKKALTKNDLKDIIGNGIAAFAGPSGVGKSTLCNSLLGFDIMQTGEVSQKIKRGRHTTRHVELHEFFDGFICDTPGFTSLSLEDQGVDYREVLNGYPEINEFATGCRFDDCSHRKEDGCVVTKALAEGKIDQGRYDRYVSFFTELYDNRNNYKSRRRQ